MRKAGLQFKFLLLVCLCLMMNSGLAHADPLGIYELIGYFEQSRISPNLPPLLPIEAEASSRQLDLSRLQRSHGLGSVVSVQGRQIKTNSPRDRFFLITAAHVGSGRALALKSRPDQVLPIIQATHNILADFSILEIEAGFAVQNLTTQFTYIENYLVPGYIYPLGAISLTQVNSITQSEFKYHHGNFGKLLSTYFSERSLSKEVLPFTSLDFARQRIEGIEPKELAFGIRIPCHSLEHLYWANEYVVCGVIAKGMSGGPLLIEDFIANEHRPPVLLGIVKQFDLVRNRSYAVSYDEFMPYFVQLLQNRKSRSDGFQFVPYKNDLIRMNFKIGLDEFITTPADRDLSMKIRGDAGRGGPRAGGSNSGVQPPLTAHSEVGQNTEPTVFGTYRLFNHTVTSLDIMECSTTLDQHGQCQEGKNARAFMHLPPDLNSRYIALRIIRHLNKTESRFYLRDYIENISLIDWLKTKGLTRGNHEQLRLGSATAQVRLHASGELEIGILDVLGEKGDSLHLKLSPSQSTLLPIVSARTKRGVDLYLDLRGLYYTNPEIFSKSVSVSSLTLDFRFDPKVLNEDKKRTFLIIGKKDQKHEFQYLFLNPQN